MYLRFHVLALLALVLGTTACEQSFREAVITRKIGNRKVLKASGICRDKSGRVDEDMKPSGADSKVLTVFACVSSALEEGTTQQAEVASRPEELQPRYTITNGNEGLMVSLRLGVEYPEGTSEALRKASLQLLRSCIRKFQSAWVKSRLDAGIEILLSETAFEESGQGGESKRSFERVPDQILSFVPAQVSNSEVAYVLSLHRQGALHWPIGSTEKIRNCAKEFPNDKVRRLKCEAKVKEELNQEFCLQLARQTAVWLGLSDPRAVADKCNENDFVVDPNDKGFHASTLKATNAEEFWKKARFSDSDLKKILAPVCQIP